MFEENFGERFKKLWRIKKGKQSFPSIRAFRELAGPECEEVVLWMDNYYAECELRYKEWRLYYVDCYTADRLTNISLYYKDELVFYSGEE